MNIIAILVSLVVTTISLLIISKLPLGIEIDNLQKGIIAALVFGILNAVLHPILTAFGLLSVLTFGLASLVANIIIFGLAALLVEGFRLRSKIWSPIIGTFALSVINSIIFKILENVGVIAPTP
ncbi:MAG: phage holin family protein [Pleurocapsa minor HA4230-MV1]|jgi:putative membrane protein|nr:phage holin family protein [Pleurocapsa minor HA4230-MV1]